MIIVVKEYTGLFEVVERRVVAQVVDFNLPNGIQNDEFTIKGGLLVGTGDGTFIEQQPGTNGEVLVYDSTQAGGIKSTPITVEMVKGTLDQWVALGLPSDSTAKTVFSILHDADNNCVYVGGNFSVIGGIAAHGMARFNLVTRQWDDMGSVAAWASGYGGYCMVRDGDSLYVGGTLRNVGGDASADSIALYTISTGVWSGLGGGFNTDGIYAMVLSDDGDSLYVGGFFATGTGAPGDSIALYTISTDTWSSIGGQLNSQVSALALNGDSLYVGGSFTDADAITTADRIALYTISTDTWSSIGGQLNGAVRALAVYSDSLYVGGEFTSADGITGADYIALYTISEAEWSSIEGELNGAVRALVINDDGTSLYVGGGFTNASGITAADYLVLYSVSTTSWSSIGTFDDVIYAICMVDNSLAVGGGFDTINGIETRMIGMLNRDLTNVLETYNAQIIQLQDDMKKITQADTGAIADDGVYSFTPYATTGIIIIVASSSPGTEFAFAWYSTATPVITSMSKGTDTAETTGVLAGTTGTDGKLTVSAHTDGKIYIENRRGGSRTCRVQVLTM